jgi:hypothetical protein
MLDQVNNVRWWRILSAQADPSRAPRVSRVPLAAPWAAGCGRHRVLNGLVFRARGVIVCCCGRYMTRLMPDGRFSGSAWCGWGRWDAALTRRRASRPRAARPDLAITQTGPAPPSPRPHHQIRARTARLFTGLFFFWPAGNGRSIDGFHTGGEWPGAAPALPGGGSPPLGPSVTHRDLPVSCGHLLSVYH